MANISSHSSTTRWLARSTAHATRHVIIGVVLLTSTACSGLLDVSNPTLVRDSDIANASGADARRQTAVSFLNSFISELTVDIARFTDEWISDRPITAQPDYLDKRDSEGYETSQRTDDRFLGLWDQVYYNTSLAITAVRAYAADSVKGEFLGQLYGIRGYTALQLAEDLCPGFPINDVTDDNRPVFGGPMTTDSALLLANAILDSAVKYAHDTTRFVTLARVAKGRALLDQGKYTEAATVVGPVATDWVYQTNGPSNGIWQSMRPGRWSNGGYNYAVGDGDGYNSLHFVSEHDPRVPTVVGGRSAVNSTDTLYITTKYTSNTSPIVLASGIEARLIEAEAALHANDPSWLTILNTLRATQITPTLAPLTMPATDSAKVDLVYHERAFWLYLTGRRLGDLRRLIKNYGRNPETVFPTGPYPLGGTYGTATAIPFILAGNQLSNPHITTGCTIR